MKRYHFDVFADYFQFTLEDEAANIGDHWDMTFSKQDLDDMYIVRKPFLLVVTARNMTVPVTIDILEASLDDEVLQQLFDTADHVIACSVEFQSGRIVVIGNDYYPDAPRIEVESGIYQIRVFYNKLDSISENGLEGDDDYHIVLFPSEHTQAKVLKHYIANE